jgi:hypothetical protein
VHIAAVAFAYLGDSTDLKNRLARLSHADLVALLCALADESASARRWIEMRAYQ